MDLATYLDSELVDLEVAPGPKEEVVTRVAAIYGRAELVSDADALAAVFMARERVSTTAIGSGLALPHGCLDEMDSTRLAVGVCREGTDFDALDDRSVHLFIAMAGPEDEKSVQLRLLARIARLVRGRDVIHHITDASTAEEVRTRLLAEDETAVG